MKVDSITLYHISMPLVSPFETSFGVTSLRECILVSVDSDGETGWGECAVDREPGYCYETTGTAWHILKDFISPLLLGQNINDANDFQRRVARIRGHNLAKAGVEMALWDLNGKRKGKSLRELLGGLRARVEVGVSVGLQDSPEALVERVHQYLDEGYGRIKIKIKPGRDVGDTEAVRKTFPHIPLQVDANSVYTLESSQVLRPLDMLELLLIEQPLFEDDLWNHHKLQKQFHTPICLDESIINLQLARSALEMEACRIINIKPGRVGGLSQAVLIHDLCKAQGVPVWCGGMLETGIGRAANLALASLPGFSLPGDISASDRYYKKDITKERFILDPGSTIDVPSGPGLGVTIDSVAIKKFSQEVLRLNPK